MTAATVAAERVDRLAGFRIGVTSDRRSSDLIAAFRRRGAQVTHAPALQILAHEHDESLVAETQAVIGHRADVVMITTGHGMRRWFEVADAAGLGAELTAVLDHAVVMARGPKAIGAVRAAGLDDSRAGEHDTTGAMVDDVIRTGRVDLTVAVQVHGFTDERQLERLRAVSREVLLVTPYRWAPPPAPDRLLRLIEAACDGELDALTFTSGPGAEATLAAARAIGREADLVAALGSRVLPVAVGPVTAAPLLARGLDPAVPDRHRMGAMIRLVCERLNDVAVQRYLVAGTPLELRGRTLVVGERQVLLGPTAFGLFRTLGARAGSVVPRHELLAGLPDQPDDHALEVAMSRLRRTLDIPGAISTVVKRGYRLNATPDPRCQR